MRKDAEGSALQYSILNGMFGRVHHTSTRGIIDERTELTEVSGIGIEVVPNLPKCRAPVSSAYRTLPDEFVPNLTGVSGRVLRPYRTLLRTSVGYLSNKHPRYNSVRPQQHTVAMFCVWPR